MIFILYALVGGMLIASVAGPLGVFVVWRKQAYFGDALAHSALLGVVLAGVFSLPVTLSVIAVSMAVAGLLWYWQVQNQLAEDTLLGILAHGALALGLVLLSFNQQPQLMGYLLGDILALSKQDLLTILVAAAGILAVLIYRWPQLVLITLSEELAQVEGIAVRRLQFLLVLIMALLIAVAMKLTGVLLMTAMMIIPAATARSWSRTCAQMAVYAALLANAAVVVGIFMSVVLDIATGPCIVVTMFGLFLCSRMIKKEECSTQKG